MRLISQRKSNSQRSKAILKNLFCSTVKFTSTCKGAKPYRSYLSLTGVVCWELIPYTLETASGKCYRCYTYHIDQVRKVRWDQIKQSSELRNTRYQSISSPIPTPKPFLQGSYNIVCRSYEPKHHILQPLPSILRTPTILSDSLIKEIDKLPIERYISNTTDTSIDPFKDAESMLDFDMTKPW